MTSALMSFYALITSSLLKCLLLIAGLLNVILLTSTLPTHELAQVFSLLSASQVVAGVSNLGFVSYCYRYLSRGVLVSRLIPRVLSLRLLGMTLGIGVCFGMSWMFDLSFLWLVLFFGATGLGQLINFNRHVLIYQQKLNSIAWSEGAQGFLFCLFLIFFWVLTGLGLFVIFISYLLSFLGAFLWTSARAATTRDWINASYGGKFNLRAHLRCLGRSFPLWLRWSMDSIINNLLVLAATYMGSAGGVAFFGVFQRLRSIAIQFFNLSISQKLPHYYSRHLRPHDYGGLGVAGVGIFALSFLGLAISEHLMLIFNLPSVGFTDVLKDVFKTPISFSALLAMSFLFAHLGAALQGQNILYSRVKASLIVSIVFLILWAILDGDPLQKGLVSLSVALAAGSIAQLSVLVMSQPSNKKPWPGRTQNLHQL